MIPFLIIIASGLTGFFLSHLNCKDRIETLEQSLKDKDMIIKSLQDFSEKKINK